MAKAKLKLKTFQTVETKDGKQWELLEKPRNCCGTRWIVCPAGGPMFSEMIRTNDIVAIIKEV